MDSNKTKTDISDLITTLGDAIVLRGRANAQLVDVNTLITDTMNMIFKNHPDLTIREIGEFLNIDKIYSINLSKAQNVSTMYNEKCKTCPLTEN